MPAFQDGDGGSILLARSKPNILYTQIVSSFLAYMPATPTLRRSLNLPLLVFYGVGTIMGAGIYALIGKVAGMSGMHTPVAFLVSAVLSALTGYSFAVLSSRFPVSSGEARYIFEAFGVRWLSLLVGLSVAVAGIISAGAIIHGFVGYFQVFFSVPAPVIIITITVLMGLLAIWGIKESALAVAVVTVVEVVGLLIIIGVTWDNIAMLPSRFPEMIPSSDISVWKGILSGAFLSFFAFIGFEDMVNVAEEVKDPVHVMPRAIGLAILVVTILYCMLALLAVLTLPADVLSQSDAPLALLYEHSTGAKPVLITTIGLLAVLNGLVVQMIMAARMFYGLSKAGWLPSVFSAVNARTQTPVFSTIVVVVLILILALAFPIVQLAQATSAVILCVFILINLSCATLCRRTGRYGSMAISFVGFLVTAAVMALQTYSFFFG